MAAKELRNTLVDVALGKIAPDLVLANARLVATTTREILSMDIAIAQGRIAAVMPAGEARWLASPVFDLEGRFVTPGFIDPHVHVEASMITVREYSRAAITHGVTMIAADPHEIGNVLGIPGMRLMFEEAATVPLKVRLRVPARIPAMPDWLETSGARIDVAETGRLLDWPEAVCLAGDINPNLILGKDGEQFDKIDLALARSMTVSGQSPGLAGARMNAFIAGGPEDNHVAGSIGEVVDNLRVGIRSILCWRPKHRLDREHFRELGQIVARQGLDTRYLQFCTDDVYPHELVDTGSIDSRVRMLIEEGWDPATAYQIATLNVAEGLRIDRDHGSITPGKCADLLVISDLERVTIDRVMVDGVWCRDETGYIEPATRFAYPDWACRSMRVGRDLAADDLKIKVSHNAPTTRARAIVTTSPKSARDVDLPTEAGIVMPDALQEIAAVAVIERHKASGRIGRGFIGGVHVKRGALACTVSHDAHNLMVIGADFEDMALAANRTVAIGGGYVLTLEGRVIFELKLPIAGLMSEAPLAQVAEQTRTLERILVETLGCPPIPRVLLKLNGFSLANIPNFGFTDFGLIDSASMQRSSALVDPGEMAHGCLH